MKSKLFFLSILIYVFSTSLNAQCTADAGPDVHQCHDEAPPQLGGQPAALNGDGPYVYEWFIEPISTISQVIPFVYASDILDDTTSANPEIIYNGTFLGNSITFFLRVTDSNGNQNVDTCVFTKTLFSVHNMIFDYYIEQGDSVYLNQEPNICCGFGNTSYNWEPAHGLSVTTLPALFWTKPDSSISYTATVTDSKGCQQTADGPTYNIYVNSVGQSEIHKDQIKLYPNPTSGLLYFENDPNKPILKIEIYNIMGRKMSWKLKPKNIIDMSEYEKGTYIFKFFYDNEILIQNVVKG